MITKIINNLIASHSFRKFQKRRNNYLVDAHSISDPWGSHNYHGSIKSKLLECEHELKLESCDLLDVGCGQGLISSIFIEKVKSFLGIDVSKEAIDICLSRYSGESNVRFKNCDIVNCADIGKFDVVNISFVLDYLGFNEHPKYFCHSILNIHNLLKNGGQVVVFNPIYDQEGVMRMNSYEEIFKNFHFVVQRKEFIDANGSQILFQVLKKIS